MTTVVADATADSIISPMMYIADKVFKKQFLRIDRLMSGCELDVFGSASPTTITMKDMLSIVVRPDETPSKLTRIAINSSRLHKIVLYITDHDSEVIQLTHADLLFAYILVGKRRKQTDYGQCGDDERGQTDHLSACLIFSPISTFTVT
jgi:hypothetical protein